MGEGARGERYRAPDDEGVRRWVLHRGSTTSRGTRLRHGSPDLVTVGQSLLRRATPAAAIGAPLSIARRDFTSAEKGASGAGSSRVDVPVLSRRRMCNPFPEQITTPAGNDIKARLAPPNDAGSTRSAISKGAYRHAAAARDGTTDRGTAR